MKDTWGLFMYLYFCFLSNVHDITYTCSINENTEVWGGGWRLLEYICSF